MSSWAPFPVVAPLLVAALVAGLDDLLPRRAADLLAAVTAGAVAAVCAALGAASRAQMLVYWFGGWRPRGGIALGIGFAIDPFGAGLAALAALLVLAALVFSSVYFDTIGNRFHSLMLVFLAGMCGFTLTGDLFNLFVYFELMSAVAFALCGYKTEEASALEGSLNFAVTNTIAAFLVLLGIGLLYGRTGALNLAQIGVALAGHGDRLVAVSFALIAGGFMVKAAIAPFHFWLPDAHAVAPTPVCVLFSGVMVEMGVYAVARLYWTVFGPALPGSATVVRDVLLGVGVATALLGGTMAFLQRHIKRLLAFSTVAHSGLMLIGVALLDRAALAGTALYVVSHALVKGALFFAAGIVLHRTGSVDEAQLHGAGKSLPVTAVVFALGGLGLAGFPPFGTFSGERLITAHAGVAAAWLPWLFVVVAVLTAGAVFRVTASVFFGWGRDDRRKQPGAGQTDERPETQGGHQRTPWQMRIAPGALIALALALGLSGRFVHGASDDALRFVSSTQYWQRVLADARPAIATVPRDPASGAEIARRMLAVAAAVALAAVALRRGRIAAPSRLKRAGSAVVLALRTIHSGRVADYVAWLMFGVGALLVAFSRLG